MSNREHKSGLIRRVFGFLWAALNGLRRFTLNLLFLLILGLIIGAMFTDRTPTVIDGSALVLKPAGRLVEQVAVNDPLEILSRGATPEQTALPDLLEAIAAAREDSRIAGLIIETDGFTGGGLAKLHELKAAVDAFRASGKPVLAWGSRFTQAQYFLASLADKVYLAPDGFVLMTGFSSYPTFFKGALDKLGVRMQVFRVGSYKSAVEPFTRSGMSPESRAAASELLNGLWLAWRDAIAERRGFGGADVDALVASYPARLQALEGDAARLALDGGLVDELRTADQWEQLLRDRFGTEEEATHARRTPHRSYLAAVREERPSEDDVIAVVAVQGAIVDGDQRAGVAGGDSIARLLRKARESEVVKAVVLRVDSPGGSVFASERIRREVELVREAGKPVVASMSSVAASGGYWVAMGADEVWAGRSTITGSIGIFGMFPDFSEPLARLGLTVDGVATSESAGALDPRRPLPPAMRAALQSNVDHGYRRFVTLVSNARQLARADVERVAQGRVWTGGQAKAHGLIDRLGGLQAAVAAAATRAKLEDFRVEWLQAERSARDEILHRLLNASGLAGEAGDGGPAAAIAAALSREARALDRWNDPLHAYAHCLCESP